MKGIVAIMPLGDEGLSAILSGEYTVYDHRPPSWDNIAAVLVDIDNARDEGLRLMEEAKEMDAFSAFPILALAHSLPGEEEAAYVAQGFFDVIQLPCPGSLLLRRIANAIRAADSITFHEMERMLKQLPSNIFLKDTQCRYVFSTQYWHHLKGCDDPSFTIRGKTDLEIRKDKNNALKAMEADKAILRTGKGVNYVIEENDDGMHEFLELIKRPVYDRNGKISGIIALINNVTEQHLLKMELEKRSQIDPLTELLNKRTTENHIRMMLTPQGRDWVHGAMLMLDVDNFKNVNDTFGHAVGDRVLVEIARIIRKNFRVMDVTGRIGGDEFMVFLRDVKERETVCGSVRRFQEQIRAAFEHMGGVSLSVGIALYPEHGETFEALYEAADQALYQVKNTQKGVYQVYGR